MAAMFVVYRFLVCCVVLFATAGTAIAQTSHPVYPGDRFAYVSGGELYVGFPNATLIPGPGNAFQPAFSYDGQWLSFLRQKWHGYDVTSHLWLARADGSGAHAVPAVGSVAVGGVQWSPTSDVLAVQPTDTKGYPLPIQLVSVQGVTRSVVGRLQGSFLWSPDGHTLAIGHTSQAGSTQLTTIDGSITRSYSLPGVRRYDRIQLAGWWPGGHSVLSWVDLVGSASLAADGMQLLALDLPTGRVHHLGIKLGYRDWIATSDKRLLVVTGGSRLAYAGKHLHVCFATGSCKALAGNTAGRISIDPAWAPEGGWNSGAMLFVVAPAWNVSAVLSRQRYHQWLNGHVLWTAQWDGSGAAPVAGVPRGAQDPEWTRDGRGALFVQDGAVWLDSHIGAANARPIARLVPAHTLPSSNNPVYQNWYLGHMNWHDLFAWY